MKLLLTAASLRKDSVNKKLIHLVATLLQEQLVLPTVKSFNDYDLPLYNGDIEAEGIPENARRFAHDIHQVDALIFAIPEYNYSISGVFKNLFDWVSRIKPMPWVGKKVLLMSASPALAGGHRGLISTLTPFIGCGALVYPDLFALANAYQAFDKTGRLVDPALEKRLETTLTQFIDFVQKMKSGD